MRDVDLAAYGWVEYGVGALAIIVLSSERPIVRRSLCDGRSACGEEPSDLGGVLVRQKEIQYSSRTRANTDQFKAIQSVRGALANVLDQVPPDILDSEDGKLLRSVADHRVYQIVHLIYRSKNYEFQSKDYDFSGISMRDHWDAGYNDAIRTLRHPEALQRPADPTGVATFDVAVDGRG